MDEKTYAVAIAIIIAGIYIGCAILQSFYGVKIDPDRVILYSFGGGFTGGGIYAYIKNRTKSGEKQ